VRKKRLLKKGTEEDEREFAQNQSIEETCVLGERSLGRTPDRGQEKKGRTRRIAEKILYPALLEEFPKRVKSVCKGL